MPQKIKFKSSVNFSFIYSINLAKFRFPLFFKNYSKGGYGQSYGQSYGQEEYGKGYSSYGGG